MMREILHKYASCGQDRFRSLIYAQLLNWDRSEVTTPVKDTIHLFNGKDLTNFYTWLGSPGKGAKPYGKNNDPERVFAVHDGVLHISGKVFGGLITEKEFEGYHLVAEFKWGERTWPPREKNARRSGILLHCVGEDGAAGGTWLESIGCQMGEGCTGDLILVEGKTKPRLAAFVEKRGGQYYLWSTTPGEGVFFNSGRLNWMHAIRIGKT